MTKTLTAADFDIPTDISWFNTAYMGITPRRVTQALIHSAAFKAAPWRVSVSDFFSEADAFRSAVARLISAMPHSIAIKGSASAAMSEAATWPQLSAGDEILLTQGQFPSNVYPWQALAARTGAQITTVKRRWNEPWTAALLAAISPRTRLAALPQVHWLDGGLIDLGTVRRALAPGAFLALDLTQSLGALPFDVADCDPDIVVAATYKWLLGPYALALCYVAPRWHDASPIEQGWINRQGSEDFSRLIDYTDKLRDDASRFDTGERSNFHLLTAATLALQILDVSLDCGLYRQLKEQNRELATALIKAGLSLEDEEVRAGHYLTVLLPDHAPDNLTAALGAKQIFISQRGRRLRLTGHLHTRANDCERLIEALSESLM
jgi:selenocysteine lyase/cysteine desulfurase